MRNMPSQAEDSLFLFALIMTQSRRPIPILLLIVFFASGAMICIVVMLALAFPGSFLETIWRLRPDARADFQDIGDWSVALMAGIGAALGLAAFGLARGAEWGRRLGLGILTVNLVGDVLNAVFRGDLRTVIGIPVGGLMIWYLSRKGTAHATRSSDRGL